MLAATLFFCAKEASYKARALKGALAFREIEVALDGEGFLASGPDANLSGRFAMADGVVLAAAWNRT